MRDPASKPFAATVAAVLPASAALAILTSCAEHERGRIGQLTPLRTVAFDSRILLETGVAATGCHL